MLTSTPTSRYGLQITFGTVAVQRLSFSSAGAVVERAERLLTQLEALGYQRHRPDRRTAAQLPG
jgi:hypothetical protein